MPEPLSNDVRERLISGVEGRMTRLETQEHFGVAPSSAVAIGGCWRRTGSFEPRPQGGDRRSGRIAIFAAEIIGWIPAEVDMTRARMSQRHGERFSQGAICRRRATVTRCGHRETAPCRPGDRAADRDR